MIRYYKIGNILWVVCLFLMMATEQVWAQGERLNRRIERLENQIAQSWSDFDLSGTKSMLERLITLSPTRTESWLMLASFSDQFGEPVLRDSAYRQILRLTPLEYPHIHLLYSESLWTKGRYNEAYDILKEYPSWDSVAMEIRKKYNHLNQCILFSMNQMRFPQLIPVRKLSDQVNSIEDEYFPALSVDGNLLVFTRQERVYRGQHQSLSDEQLFSAHWSATSFSEVAALGPTVNTTGNEGTQTLRQDGRWMIFTACNRPDTKGGCDLYLSVRIGDQWSAGINLGYPVNTRYWESTPALAPDGKGLVFASNRPGGEGGMDLWYSRLLPEGGWSSPVNLGRPVNTEKDEMAPFLHSDGNSLFFSSNGHIGMGGFDLFLSRFSSFDSISSPINLGYPLNTFHHEDGITMNGTADRVIIASDRDSMNGRDLYQVDLPIDVRPHSVVPLSGVVRDGISGLPLNASIRITALYGSYSSLVETDPSNGRFLIGLPSVDSLRLAVEKEGYLFFSAVFYIGAGKTNENHMIVIDLMPIQKGSTTVLRNVFFSFDSAEILPESFPELSDLFHLLQSNPTLRLEVAGHTDSMGTGEYNMILSQLRAEAIIRYIIARGIDPNRLMAKGYGESRPIADNNTEEGQKMNRRTEISVLSGR